MLKVRLIPYRPELGKIYARQTRHGLLESLDHKYKFFVNEEVDDPDFVVVQGKGLRSEQTFHVAPQNTIMLTTEPRSVLVYPQKYLRQFGMVCTCQHPTKHPNVDYRYAILPWFVGFKENVDGCVSTIDYDQLKQSALPRKTKLLSVITSNKAFTKGHIDRIRFVERLKEHFGGSVDIFGRGFADFEDKWDVLAPYQYHIAIENSSQDYYWTEKISDCFLAGAYPFYHGCTNIDDYFPKGSLTRIDISQPDKAIDIIQGVVSRGLDEHNRQALLEAKRLVLDEYNMFEVVARLCDRLDPGAARQQVTLMPCHSGSDWRNLWNYTVKHNYYKMKMRLMGSKL